MEYWDFIGRPDAVLLQTESGWADMQRQGSRRWVWKDAEAEAADAGGGLAVSVLANQTPLLRLAMVWKHKTAPGARILGDCWERGYGDMEWRGVLPERVMPWYFLLHDGSRTHGLGVMTGPKAMCFWQVTGDTVVLCLDVRCGGMGVTLGGRRVALAVVAAREGAEGETPYQAACAYCRALCPAPLMPPQPVYGGNNWYYAYGKSSHEEILVDSKFVRSLAPSGGNAPFMIIDEGWAAGRGADTPSLWRRGNERFPDMGRLADEMKAIGVRPGIWVRPLSLPDGAPGSLCLPSGRFKAPYAGKYLDPSIPEALEIVAEDIAQQVRWGYELIKHDYTTFDLLGRWGFEMGMDLTNEGWRFADASKTTAEIVGLLYRAIRRAAGGALLIGCNTVGHIGASLFEMQRAGDDTSGRQWERTRKMGVNTMAFALPKHGAFFAMDADCAGITSDVPWALNRQWLELLAKSGTPLFVSAAPGSTGEKQKTAIREAFAIASAGVSAAEPLDWMDTTCPKRWRLCGEETEFDWHRQDCVEPCRA